MTDTLPRRYILAAPPDAHAGIGNALRCAFRLPERTSTAMFRKLLDALNRR
jgi:hypothetical protein